MSPLPRLRKQPQEWAERVIVAGRRGHSISCTGKAIVLVSSLQLSYLRNLYKIGPHSVPSFVRLVRTLTTYRGTMGS